MVNKIESGRLRNTEVFLATLIIGILFYALNYYTPLYADDYSYAFSFATGERIHSASEILESQIGHYQNTNGRSVTHYLAQLFLLLGDSVFNYINVLFFLLLIYLIYYHACGSFKNLSVTWITIIAALLFLSTPNFGQSFLWITGAANYLYGILIVLSVLLPYRIQLRAGVACFHPLIEMLAAVVYFALGIIAGWTNENTAVAMIVMIIAYMLVFFLKNIKIHLWNVTGCIGGVVGCALMLSSPGTNSRLEGAGGSGGVVDWLKRLVFYSCDMMNNLCLILLLLAILFVLYYIHRKHHLTNTNACRIVAIIIKECDIAMLYFIGFLVSVYSMIVSPQFPGRAWSGPVVLCLIVLINMGVLVDISKIKLGVGKIITVSFLLLLCGATYINAFFELKNIDVAYHHRISAIEIAVSTNERCVAIPSISGWSGYSCYLSSGDLKADSDEWPNTAIANYYGIDEIIRND